MTSPLSYVGEKLTITSDAVLLDDGGMKRISYAEIAEVEVLEPDPTLGTGARLVISSPRVILAMIYSEAPPARQAYHIVTRAVNARGRVTRSQRMRGEPYRGRT